MKIESELRPRLTLDAAYTLFMISKFQVEFEAGCSYPYLSIKTFLFWS